MIVACPVSSSAFAQPDTPFPATAATGAKAVVVATATAIAAKAAIATAPAIAAGERDWGLT